jgi:hypothetical protein
MAPNEEGIGSGVTDTCNNLSGTGCFAQQFTGTNEAMRIPGRVPRFLTKAKSTKGKIEQARLTAFFQTDIVNLTTLRNHLRHPSQSINVSRVFL